MLDQQIESISNKLIQFLQDLTINIQRRFPNENFFQLFKLCSDYAKQLACLFHTLINEYLQNCMIQIQINLDPVQIWRLIQNLIEQLNEFQGKELELIIQNIRNINKYFYNLLLQLKNIEFFNLDQTRTINENLIDELNHLSDNLIHFTTNFQINSSNTNNNHLNEKSPISPSINSNCYPCNMTNNFSQQSYWTGINQNPCFQSNPRFPHSKPMDCNTNIEKDNTSIPLCFPTPVVYTPEMEALFSSGGIIYARKSGNTWIAENLGTLIETLKDISDTIDMNEHCEILIRKTGELFSRSKKGRRKRFLQKTLNKSTYEQSDSNTNSNDDQ